MPIPHMLYNTSESDEFFEVATYRPGNLLCNCGGRPHMDAYKCILASASRGTH